jgi:hypothetical protein
MVIGAITKPTVNIFLFMPGWTGPRRRVPFNASEDGRVFAARDLSTPETLVDSPGHATNEDSADNNWAVIPFLVHYSCCGRGRVALQELHAIAVLISEGRTQSREMKGWRAAAGAAVIVLVYESLLQTGARPYVFGPVLVLLAGLGSLLINPERGKPVGILPFLIVFTAAAMTAAVLWFLASN